MRALLEVTLVDMATVVADGVRDVEREVVTALYSGYAQQLTVLLLAEVLLEVTVECRTTGEVLDVLRAMQTETIEYVERGVFYYVAAQSFRARADTATSFLIHSTVS